MVRTMDSGSRASGAKAPRKGVTAASTPSSSSNKGSSSSSASIGGNPACPRETPSWQKPITTFFIKPKNDSPKKTKDDSDTEITKDVAVDEKENQPSSSNTNDKPKRKKLIIEDDED